MLGKNISSYKGRKELSSFHNENELNINEYLNWINPEILNGYKLSQYYKSLLKRFLTMVFCKCGGWGNDQQAIPVGHCTFPLFSLLEA